MQIYINLVTIYIKPNFLTKMIQQEFLKDYNKNNKYVVDFAFTFFNARTILGMLETNS